ncbi:MAG: endo alpha-1,4 polygalactosaminidase, partial [Thermoleophilaceae bacterium]
LIIIGAAFTGAAAANTGAERQRQLAGVETFAFALGGGASAGDLRGRFAGYDLVVVEPDETSGRRVKQLRDEGKIVLAYLSVGTIEKYRFWYRAAKKYRLRDKFDEFDEYYARTNRAGYRRLMVRVARRYLRRKRVDGLFLDNTDFIDIHPRQKRGLRRLVFLLARLTHRRDKLLFTQNGEDLINPVLRRYDGWNREDVSWTFDFDQNRYEPVPAIERLAAQQALRRIKRAGLLVTSADYTARGDQAAFDESVANSCAAGAIPYVSNIQLRRIPQPAPRC